MSLTTSDGGHELHLSIHEKAEGGQKSLAKQIALSNLTFKIVPLQHGQWIVEPNEYDESMISLYFELDM